jgi:hypothetical protein
MSEVIKTTHGDSHNNMQRTATQGSYHALRGTVRVNALSDKQECACSRQDRKSKQRGKQENKEGGSDDSIRSESEASAWERKRYSTVTILMMRWVC